MGIINPSLQMRTVMPPETKNDLPELTQLHVIWSKCFLLGQATLTPPSALPPAPAEHSALLHLCTAQTTVREHLPSPLCCFFFFFFMVVLSLPSEKVS